MDCPILCPLSTQMVTETKNAKYHSVALIKFTGLLAPAADFSLDNKVPSPCLNSRVPPLLGSFYLRFCQFFRPLLRGLMELFLGLEKLFLETVPFFDGFFLVTEGLR